MWIAAAICYRLDALPVTHHQHSIRNECFCVKETWSGNNPWMAYEKCVTAAARRYLMSTGLVPSVDMPFALTATMHYVSVHIRLHDADLVNKLFSAAVSEDIFTM